MKPSNSSKPAAEIVAAIRALDLDPIKVKLIDAEDGHGWTREYAERMEVAYKRFLTLLVTHPETTIAPSKEIDKFWHAHILDTMKYADDCQQVFGYFLHHFPYFGLRGADDAAQLERAGRETARLFAEEFSDSISNVATHCMAAQPQDSAAHCMSSVTAAGPAHCMAAKPVQDSAHCMAAISNVDAAHCMAAVPQNSSAHCMSAVTAKGPAHCMAAVSDSGVAHCMAAKPDIAARPALALAA